MLKRFFSSAFSAVVLTVSVSAFASEEQAQASYQRGVELFREGRYEAANEPLLDAFKNGMPEAGLLLGDIAALKPEGAFLAVVYYSSVPGEGSKLALEKIEALCAKRGVRLVAVKETRTTDRTGAFLVGVEVGTPICKFSDIEEVFAGAYFERKGEIGPTGIVRVSDFRGR